MIQAYKVTYTQGYPHCPQAISTPNICFVESKDFGGKFKILKTLLTNYTYRIIIIQIKKINQVSDRGDYND